MANRIVSVHAGIYAIMLPSSGFSVAHCLTMRVIQRVRYYDACDL